MKIDSYAIGMDSARTFSSSSTRKLAIGLTRQNFEGSLASMTDAFTDSEGTNIGSDQKESAQDQATDSRSSIRDMIDSMQSPISQRIKQIENNSSIRQIEDVHQKFVVYLWRLLFGHEKSKELAEEFGFASPYDDLNPPNSFQVIKIQGVQESYYEENESVSFTSNGNVTTEDGRSISFNIDVEMSRSFVEYYREEGLSIGNMCDPLVINFSGNPAELTDTKISFDLDNDGNNDSISTLAEGSGFLALDKNNDGIINNGSELFGTSSGDGFYDLSKYDSDNNGWIDENDEIFNNLKIWVKDNNGYDKLYTLKDKNIGAIYLGSADTNFTLRSANSGNVNGAIRKTGIFLYEDGSGVGTLNHLDIAN